MSDKKFKVEFREWYYDKDKKEWTKYLGEFMFSQEKGRKNSIKDIKNFITEKSISELHNPVCSCFLLIYKAGDEAKTFLTKSDYKDETLLDDTIFNETNPIIVCIPIEGKICKCGSLQNNEIYSNVVKKLKEEKDETEKKKKQSEDEMEKKINEMQKNYDSLMFMKNAEIQRQRRDFQNFINFQREQNMHERMENKRILQNLEENINTKDELINNISKKLEENENKEKKIKKIKKIAEKTYLNKINKYYEYFYKNNIDLIISQFLKDINDFKIQFDNLTKDIIFKIAEDEKYSMNLKNILEDKFDSLKSDNFDVSHFNILLIGNTGVGKSTLLNTILKGKYAQTHDTRPCTMKLQFYESEKVKGLRIYDTRGIENGKYNIDEANKTINKAIKQLIKDQVPDKFIHCIWYCVHSNRFSDEEFLNLKNCYDLYIESLPIIIVFTQSDNQKNTDKMVETIKNGFIDMKKNERKQLKIKIIKILAQDSQTDIGPIYSFGIHQLMKETFESSEEGISRSFVESYIEQGKKIIINEFKNIIKDIKEEFFKKENEGNAPPAVNFTNSIDLNNIGKGNNNNQNNNNNFNNNQLNNNTPNNNAQFNNFIPDNKFDNNRPYDINQININTPNNNKIINNIIEEEGKAIKNILKEVVARLLLKEKISKKNESNIEKLINDKLKDIKFYFDELFKKHLPNISNDLAECLGELVNKIDGHMNQKYQTTHLSAIYNHNRLKKDAKKNIISYLKPLIEKRIYKEINKKLFKLFCNEFSGKLIDYFDFLIINNRGINSIFKNKGKDKAKRCCERIKSQLNSQFPIDDYNIKNSHIINIMKNMNNMNYINKINNNNINNNMNHINNMDRMDYMNKANNMNQINNTNQINNMNNVNNPNMNYNMNNFNIANNPNMDNNINKINNNLNNNMNINKNLYNIKGPNISLFDEDEE